MQYTYENVLEAYIKLKPYIYYDTTNLYMRKQLAIFGTNLADDFDFLNRIGEYNYFKKKYNIQKDEDDVELTTYEEKLRVFTAALNSFHENPEYFLKFLKGIEVKNFPQKNKRLKKEYKSNNKQADGE